MNPAPRPSNRRLALLLGGLAMFGPFSIDTIFPAFPQIGAQFEPLNLRQQSELVRLTFSRADTWAESWGSGQPDTPLAALREVGSIGIGGLFTLGRATLNELRLALRRTPTQPLDTLMDKP